MGNHARWMLRDASLSGENKTAVKEFLNSACPNHDADAVSWESLDVRNRVNCCVSPMLCTFVSMTGGDYIYEGNGS